jgi:Na+-driven multidrug efflux pump
MERKSHISHNKLNESGYSYKSQKSLQSIEEHVFHRRTSTRLHIGDDVTMKLAFYNLLPNILIPLMFNLIGNFESHFIGRTKDVSLYDSLGLGQMYSYLFLYYTCGGINETLLIILPKSFGNKEYKQMGTQTNQIRIITYSLFIIMTLMTVFLSRYILLLLAGGETGYINEARLYTLYTIPGFFFEINLDIYSKYSESHLKNAPVVTAVLLGAVIHPILCWTCVEVYKLRMVGIAIAFNIATFVKLIYIMSYMMILNPFHESHQMPDRKTFKWKQIWVYTKLSIVTMFTHIAEVIGETFNGVVAARLYSKDFAKYIVLYNITNINDSFTVGYMNTASLLVGNFVGAFLPKNVRKSILYLFYYFIIIYLPLIILTLIFQTEILKFYNAKEDIYLSHDLPIYLNYFTIHLVLAVFSQFLVGVLRGLNHVTVPMYVTIALDIGFMPVASAIFALVYGMGLGGIVLSKILTYVLTTICWVYYFIFHVDIIESCAEYKEQNEEYLATIREDTDTERSLVKSEE